MIRFNKRRLFAALMIAAGILLCAAAGIVAYLNSARFATRVRQYIVREIQDRTGARVTLNHFDWSLRRQRIRLEDLTIRGSESPDSAALAHFNRIDIGLNLRTLLQRRIDLFELTFDQPEFHLLVRPDGQSNVPSPRPNAAGTAGDFQISVRNFSVLRGSAILNEQRVHIDLSLTNLAATLNYHDTRQVLETHFSYDGVLDRAPDVRLAIPYDIAVDADYTRGTIVAQRVVLSSGRSQLTLQGKISQVLDKNISGKLEYRGRAEARFLNYFFPADAFDGNADAEGSLEFSRALFATQGIAKSEAIGFAGWRATGLRTEYAYRYPERALTLDGLETTALAGSIAGNAKVENLPGPSRVLLDLNYAHIDAAQVARVFPWASKYRLHSNAAGTLNGWIEGRLARFDLSGHLDLTGYAAASRPDTVPLALDGSTDYRLQPGETRISNAEARFNSTSIKASGLIEPPAADLKIDATSSDLRDIAFIYQDANGKGSFTGTVSGEIATPVVTGDFRLEEHAYRRWKIQQAAGGVQLDLKGGNAVFRNVRIVQGESQLILNGTAPLSEPRSQVDLRVQSNRVAAQDLQPFIAHNFDGLFAGDAHFTSLSPTIKVEGDIRADNVTFQNQLIGTMRGHVRYFEPLVQFGQVTVRQNGSSLTGNISYDEDTGALQFATRLDSVNLHLFHGFGLPASINGTIRQADLKADGSIGVPNVQGGAALQDFSVYGETFPQARMEISSAGSKLNVGLEATNDVSLKAQIDIAEKNYPFTARAAFRQYPLERMAKVANGTIRASGTADLSGLLTDQTRLRGEGNMDETEIRIQGMSLSATKPFRFGFDSDELTLSDVTLTGQSTDVTLRGTIGLREQAPLNLDAAGQVNLELLAAEYPGLASSGTVDLRIDVGGTVEKPDFRGTAVLANASLSRPGFFTSLTNLNGSLLFNQDQIRLSDVEGQVGGGKLRAGGTAVLGAGTIQAMNIELDATSVRLRGYPEGLRTVLNGKTVLRGTMSSPLLEGTIEIENLAYRSSFEDFLTLFSEERLQAASSPLGRLRLSLHVEGGKNITIQNQLAEVEARVDLDWKGTVDEPSITGRIEASGGTLSFQGNRYTVTRGNIDFVDPLRIQPVIDLEAESQVRDYRVILSITGKGDNPKLAMRSDPPLPELEIVSLIAGGRTREEIAEHSPNPPTSERLFQSGAASILFDLLEQRVGNRLGLLGGGRVRVEPFLVGAESSSGARITFSEQLTKDLSITYSQDLSSTRQQVILIEYFVTRNTSVVASRDELGNLGLDLRHRTRIK